MKDNSVPSLSGPQKDLGSLHFMSDGLTFGQLLVPFSACETFVRCHSTDDVPLSLLYPAMLKPPDQNMARHQW